MGVSSWFEYTYFGIKIYSFIEWFYILKKNSDHYTALEIKSGREDMNLKRKCIAEIDDIRGKNKGKA